MKLFLDDIKNPLWYGLNMEDLTVCGSAEEALNIISRKEPLEILYLDHDMGLGMSGYTFLSKLIEEFNLPPRRVIIISFNSVGILKIRALCEQYDIPCQIGKGSKTGVLTKTESTNNNLRSNNIEGIFIDIPIVGKSFEFHSAPLTPGASLRIILTSEVREIVNQSTTAIIFKTLNSTYNLQLK